MPVVALGDVVVDHAATSDALGWHLAWHFDALPPRPGPADLTVRLGERDVAPPSTPPTMQDGPLLRHDGGDVLHLHHEDGPTARVDEARLDIDTRGHDPGDWRPTRQLLFSALCWWFERRGTVLLHAGLAARDGDDGLLLLGHTGAGKSTLAVATLVAGHRLHADDLTLVRRGPSGLEGFGLPRRVVASRDLASAAGLEGVPLAGDQRGRVVLADGLLATGWVTLRGLVVVGHDAGAGRLGAVPHGEALDQVVGSWLESPRQDAVRRRLGLLAGLAALPAHRLGHAADPAVRLERAAALLAAVWDGG